LKILLVYPTYPDTFWSFGHILSLISKRAGFPPLGLATVASMLPEQWEKRLIDMNVSSLGDQDVQWADYVFISAMDVQRKSASDVIERCNGLGVKVVAGGPLFTTSHEEFDGVDHFVLNEAEVTLAPFLRDIENGCAHRIYTSDERPDVTRTPNPVWKLLDMKKYASMNVQYSRGCPYNCEFCDITFLNGHRPRTKDAHQLVAEMESLYQHGWRGNVFIVDDNFIGNKKKLKAEVLPVLIEWSERRGYPFSFTTEASVNMADDEELMRLMVRAGFSTVFLGIETPDERSLEECGKFQNRERDLVATVKKIQNHGFQVQGGFIVGFDNDTPSIFRRQIEFIQRSGIATAMVGLLNAPKGTRLYERLRKENRLVKAVSGDNMDFSINFKPKMDWGTLVAGYRDILNTIYSPKNYYARIRTFLREYRPPQGRKRGIRPHEIWTITKTLWALGVKEKGRVHFWKNFATILLKYRSAIREFVTISAYGLHFRKVAEQGNISS
jgi:radical SAM superfamily enzyme YgiQ (UPF0313 family)